jgi:hypothetical protein
MTDFLAKTWFIWWIIIDLAILRWFHLVSWDGVEPELEDADAKREGIDGGSTCELNSIRP